MVQQTSAGSSRSTHNGQSFIVDDFEYPFYLQLTYNRTDTFYDYGVMLDHAYNRALSVPGTIGRTVKTRQLCNGTQVGAMLYAKLASGSRFVLFSMLTQVLFAYELAKSRRISSTLMQERTLLTKTSELSLSKIRP